MSAANWTAIEITPGLIEVSNGDLTLTVDRDLHTFIESERFGSVTADARALIEGAEVLKRVLTERYGAVV